MMKNLFANTKFTVRGYYVDYEYLINENIINFNISPQLLSVALLDFKDNLFTILNNSNTINNFLNIQLFIKVCYTDSDVINDKSNEI